MEAQAPLPRWFTDLLAHRRWVHRTHPFPHVYVREVFDRRFYERLAAEFEKVSDPASGLFGPVAQGYSATGANLTAIRDSPLEIFLSRAWHDLIAGVVGARGAVTGDVEGSLHHHEPNSPRGWPHNDLAPAWFPDRVPGPGEVGLPAKDIDLKSGARPDGVEARELVRAVAVLFYLGNGDWQPGHGGETSLFTAPDSAAPESMVKVPPLNNSMIVFECAPRTWHTFAGGNTAARNSVVMWLHQPREQAVRRWGGTGIVDW
ncbi:2OG-Fe(II) oxygenase family protein [Nocardia alni]|uniref:2OG-Fe(II) oxygenase family protein n=1 Tax=Nocardia alni TaxID=2815723 RepID=UPI001C22D7D2|nr:2OG-Fe(II) oxygenase [Nocardia alni]